MAVGASCYESLADPFGSLRSLRAGFSVRGYVIFVGHGYE